MQVSYLLLFGLVVLASANTLPNSYSTQSCTSIITANYDDLPKQPPASVPNPVPPYRGLKYSNIVLFTPMDGIIPASSPNVVGFGVVTAASRPSVTIIGGGTPYTVFALACIAYACAVGIVETVVSVPISCTLAFSGYRAGALVKRQIANYEVAIGEVNKNISVAKLYDFGLIDTLTFELVTPTQPVTATFDSFQYYGKCV